MESERVEPPPVAGEREMLDAWLDFHRATLELKCAGLGQPDLCRRAVPPSELSLLGIVRHMTEVEQRWVQWRFLGHEIEQIYQRPDAPNAAFLEVDGADAEVDLARFAAECASSRRALAGTSLDEVAPRPLGGRNLQPNLRYVLTHLVEEYARHNGHADLLRESIDGSVGL